MSDHRGPFGYADLRLRPPVTIPLDLRREHTPLETVAELLAEVARLKAHSDAHGDLGEASQRIRCLLEEARIEVALMLQRERLASRLSFMLCTRAEVDRLETVIDNWVAKLRNANREIGDRTTALRGCLAALEAVAVPPSDKSPLTPTGEQVQAAIREAKASLGRLPHDYVAQDPEE